MTIMAVLKHGHHQGCANTWNTRDKMGYESQKYHKEREPLSEKAHAIQREKETVSSSKKTQEAGGNQNGGWCVSPFMAHVGITGGNGDFLVSQKSTHTYPLRGYSGDIVVKRSTQS